MKRTYFWVEYDEEIGFDEDDFLDELGEILDKKTEQDDESMTAKIEAFGLKK